MLVALWGYLDVPPERLEAVLKALPGHIALTRAEPGCLNFSVEPSPQQPTRLRVAETFTDRAAFEAHQARAGGSSWAEVTAGIERHYRISSLPEMVENRARFEGREGEQWLAGLAATIRALEDDWHISIGEALPGGTAAFCAEASNSTGDTFVIKINTPGSEIGRHEAAVLRLADGKGYVRLLRHDPTRNAMLLEKLGERLDTTELTHQTQVEIVASVLLEAWMPVPPHGNYTTGAEKANSLAAYIIATQEKLGRPCPPPVMETVLRYCRERAALYHPEGAVLAHGDPHPGNLLADPTTDPIRFKLVDPDGLAIEPAYDLGVLIRNWNEGLDGRHAHDMARARVRVLTQHTQVGAEAIWQWGYIERISTGMQLIELGAEDEGRELLRVAERLVP